MVGRWFGSLARSFVRSFVVCFVVLSLGQLGARQATLQRLARTLALWFRETTWTTVHHMHQNQHTNKEQKSFFTLTVLGCDVRDDVVYVVLRGLHDVVPRLPLRCALAFVWGTGNGRKRKPQRLSAKQ